MSPSPDQPITEDDLNAHADGRLDPARAEAVRARLAADPALADEVAGWQADAEAIRARYDEFHRAGPEDLPAPGAARPRRRLAALAAAASLVLFLGGGVAGYLLRDAVAPAGAVAAPWLPRIASDVHVTYAREVRHPVEVGADEEEHLVAWLGNRLDFSFTPPDLSARGFELVGGRLLPVGGLPAAMLMYEDAGGNRVTLLLARNPGDPDTAFQFSAEDGVRTYYWIDGPRAYAITARLDRDDLEAVTRSIYYHFGG